jgi:hypothetical protein
VLGLVWFHSSPDIGGAVTLCPLRVLIMCTASRRALHMTKESLFTQQQYPQNQNLVTDVKY